MTNVDKSINNFMSNLEILDVRFYSSINENSGYIKVRIEEKIYECNFELDERKVELKKLYDKKTKEDKLEFLLEKINNKIEENQDFYGFLKDENHNKYFVLAIEEAISKGLAKKLINEVQIEFVEFKLLKDNYYIKSYITIFNKIFEVSFHKLVGYFTIYVNGRNGRMDEWFLNKIKTHKENKGDSLFYVDPSAMKDFYGINGLLGEMLILKYKETKHYKMSILYDDEIKVLFKDEMENGNEK